jgi:hypothetical protein
MKSVETVSKQYAILKEYATLKKQTDSCKEN